MDDDKIATATSDMKTVEKTTGKPKVIESWRMILRERNRQETKITGNTVGEMKRMEIPSQCNDLQKWIHLCKIMISDNAVHCNKL
jgi:hypothetical protein